jgi:hypothetical protein
MELETKLREKELMIERLERDRRWFSDREKEEREEKDREREAHEDDKVYISFYNTYFMFIHRSHSENLTVIHALCVFL